MSPNSPRRVPPPSMADDSQFQHLPESSHGIYSLPSTAPSPYTTHPSTPIASPSPYNYFGTPQPPRYLTPTGSPSIPPAAYSSSRRTLESDLEKENSSDDEKRGSSLYPSGDSTQPASTRPSWGPVPLNRTPDQVVAEEQTAGRRKRRKWWIWGSLIAVVVLGGVGAGVGVAMAKKGGSSTSPSPATATPAGGSVTNSTSNSTSGSNTATVKTSYSRIVVIGASYCDNGHARTSNYSFSLTSAPYYKGRRSNGIVWDEYLAQMIAAPGQSSADMNNYAYSGAMVDNSLDYAAVPDTATQITMYRGDVSSGKVKPLPSGGRNLIAVWIGLNPLLSTWTTTISNNPTLTPSAVNTALAHMNATATALFNQLNSLRADSKSTGDFLILPIPPTEILPYAVQMSNGDQSHLNLFKNLTIGYNAALAAGVAKMQATSVGGTTVLTYDIPTLYRNVIKTPSLITGVSDVTDPCVSGTNSVCSAPASYLWWDSIHMTTNAHKYVAQAVAPAVKSLWAL
ncbi:hypothetical protein T439DRAFT_324701 [Meredithblackwellia eburnea MCA 4105]